MVAQGRTSLSCVVVPSAGVQELEGGWEGKQRFGCSAQESGFCPTQGISRQNPWQSASKQKDAQEICLIYKKF